MIDFPSRTRVGRRLPKEAFYQHLSLTKALKAKFVSDVERIDVANSLTKENLNLEQASEVKEILLLTIQLKKQNFDGKLVEAIARQNPHKLIFLLEYEDYQQMAVYHRKLYQTEWMKSEKVGLSLSGSTLSAIWEDLVRQIALHSEAVAGQKEQNLDEQLKKQDEMDRLQKLIKKTEAAVWKEPQPKKKYALYTKLQGYQKQLEDIIDGKA